MQAIGIVANTGKQEAVAAAARLTRELEARGLSLVMTPECSSALRRADLERPFPQGWEHTDLIIVLGGDGTLLRHAKAVTGLKAPVLGVNTGHLGFLTEFEVAEFFPALDEILAGQWAVEERMMLKVTVCREDRVLYADTALNDVVLARGPLARMVHVSVALRGTVVADYPADGVIVATPTGSTAYSLSAGGPICDPLLQLLLVTPICPHTFNSRALVVPADEAVTCRVHNAGEVLMTVDGRHGFTFMPGDAVRVGRAPTAARLVRRNPYRFYDILRRKLSEPGRKIGTTFGVVD